MDLVMALLKALLMAPRPLHCGLFRLCLHLFASVSDESNVSVAWSKHASKQLYPSMCAGAGNDCLSRSDFCKQNLIKHVMKALALRFRSGLNYDPICCVAPELISSIALASFQSNSVTTCPASWVVSSRRTRLYSLKIAG